DIDPPRDGTHFDKEDVVRNLSSVAPKPTLIIDSGGGMQALWALQDEASQEQIERVNRAIAQRFGGGNCWNVDRLMRLPGTINYPGAKKRQLGRVRALATLVTAHSGAYPIAELEVAFGVSPQRSQPTQALERLGIAPEHPLYDLIAAPR